MEQQKHMSLKLSNYIEAPEANLPLKSAVESAVESQILKPRIVPQQDENGGKSMFTGAVFNNCQFTFGAADAGFTGEHAVVPKKKFKRILPLSSDSDDEL